MILIFLLGPAQSGRRKAYLIHHPNPFECLKLFREKIINFNLYLFIFIHISKERN